MDATAEQKRFSQEVDQVLLGEWDSHSTVMVSRYTPKVLLDLGLDNKPILYRAGHLRSALRPKDAKHPHWHGLDVDQIKSLPALIEKPCAVVASRKANHALVCVTNAVDNDDLPIVVVIDPNGRGPYRGRQFQSNFNLSTYGRSNIDRYLATAEQDGRLMYVNKARLSSLFSKLGRTIPESLCESFGGVKQDPDASAATIAASTQGQ